MNKKNIKDTQEERKIKVKNKQTGEIVLIKEKELTAYFKEYYEVLK